MRRYKVKIGFMTEETIWANNKKEAEELAWHSYDQDPPEPTAEIKVLR